MKTKTLHSIISHVAVILAVAMAPYTVRAQRPAEIPDTVVAVQGHSRLLITETPEGVTMVVNDVDGDSTIIIDRKYPANATISAQIKRRNISFDDDNILRFGHRGSPWGITSGQLTLGLVKALDAPAGCPLEWGKSIEIGWVNALALSYNRGVSRFSLGIGFDWRNYKVTTDSRLVVDQATGSVGWDSYPEGTIHKNSRLKVFSLGFPLLWRVSIPGTRLNIEAGAIFNFNTHASLKTVWLETTGGNKVESYTDRVGQRRFTVDLYARIGLSSWIGVYARYGTRSTLRNISPSFSPLSVGVVLF